MINEKRIEKTKKKGKEKGKTKGKGKRKGKRYLQEEGLLVEGDVVEEEEEHYQNVMKPVISCLTQLNQINMQQGKRD